MEENDYEFRKKHSTFEEAEENYTGTVSWNDVCFRQTISKWEADEVIPELDKIVALSDLFACKLDAMVKEDMSAGDAVYSEIIVKR